MKAVGFKTSLSIENDESFIEFEAPIPLPEPRDLLVKVEAISVNPVDFKRRQNMAKDVTHANPLIIGWDAVGIVESVGDKVKLFKKGDKVFYAGDITRQGSNAEYQVVDERIVGMKPQNLSTEESAAMPLTSLTAWEILFDRLRIDSVRDQGKSVLIIGGAGGVGSIAIQLAKKVCGLKVIATASRPESIEWCTELGADHVVNHYDLLNEVRKAGFKYVDYILDFVDAYAYWDLMVELIKPQGHIASITDSAQPIELIKLKSKSASFSWELMYTRSMFQTEDMEEQHNILEKIARLLDEGILKSTLHETFHGLTAENFKKAHSLLESGKSIGKIVIKFI